MSDSFLWFYNIGTYVLGGFATIFTFFWLRKFNSKLNLSVINTILITALVMALGFFSIKAFSVLEMFSIEEGLQRMSLFGSIFIMPLFIYLISKIIKVNPCVFFDIMTICLIFTLICGRTNCIIYGCCKGIPFFGSETFLWPVRELEIAFNIVMLFVLGNRVIKDLTCGEVYPIFAICYGIFRFLIEFVRAVETKAFIHPGHICGLISIAIGVCGLIYLKKVRLRNL